jgi:molybdopterin converting factor subunit 1
MNISVRLFATPKQIAGCDLATLELPAAATIADLRHALVRKYPDLLPMSGQLKFAINAEYAIDSAVLHEADDVACIPPVSGG